jgi:hypothetical protein
MSEFFTVKGFSNTILTVTNICSDLAATTGMSVEYAFHCVEIVG